MHRVKILVSASVLTIALSARADEQGAHATTPEDFKPDVNYRLAIDNVASLPIAKPGGAWNEKDKGAAMRAFIDGLEDVLKKKLNAMEPSSKQVQDYLKCLKDLQKEHSDDPGSRGDCWRDLTSFTVDYPRDNPTVHAMIDFSQSNLDLSHSKKNISDLKKVKALLFSLKAFLKAKRDGQTPDSDVLDSVKGLVVDVRLGIKKDKEYDASLTFTNLPELDDPQAIISIGISTIEKPAIDSTKAPPDQSS